MKRRVFAGIIANPKLTGSRYLWLETYSDGSQKAWPYNGAVARGKTYPHSGLQQRMRQWKRIRLNVIHRALKAAEAM